MKECFSVTCILCKLKYNVFHTKNLKTRTDKTYRTWKIEFVPNFTLYVTTEQNHTTATTQNVVYRGKLSKDVDLLLLGFFKT